MVLPSPSYASGSRSANRIESVAALRLPADSPVRRIPTRPVDMRGPDFDAQFDAGTVVYDAILAANGREVRLICPALLNLRTLIETAVFRALPSGELCAFTSRALDRQDQFIVQVPEGTDALSIKAEFGTIDVRFSDERNSLFEGERAIFTRSKNNRIEWIADWIRFYRDVHGATAALIYDNNSTAYSKQQLLNSLGNASGLNRIVVVDWPFKHGPTGKGVSKRYWDSDFSQLGAFEHARWRFLSRARSVLNCDIDELALCGRGKTVFAEVERTQLGVFSFFGDWVPGIEGFSPPLGEGYVPRLRDYHHIEADESQRTFGFLPIRRDRCMPKWAIVPQRCPAGAQWQHHAIKGWPVSRLINPSFSFRHFREISTNWKYDRSERKAFDPRRHQLDQPLTNAFEQVDWDH